VLQFLQQMMPVSLQYVELGWLWSWLQITQLIKASLVTLTGPQLTLWVIAVAVVLAAIIVPFAYLRTALWSLWRAIDTAITVVVAAVLGMMTVGVFAWAANWAYDLVKTVKI